ncbi:MAG TPA: hypothetical protein VNT79_07070 [Phycisphaerae bacterium]|nr:hypothetical protein [Phycisphaerae bacterium]
MSERDKKLNDEIAEGERWLAGFGRPAASDELLARIKQSVRHEVLRVNASAAVGRSWKHWHGALAAAASIALCVGVAGYSTRFQPLQRATLVQDLEPVAVEREVTALLSFLPASDDELAELEESNSDDAWALDGPSLYEAMEAAFEDDASESGAWRSDDSTSRNGRIS